MNSRGESNINPNTHHFLCPGPSDCCCDEIQFIRKWRAFETENRRFRNAIDDMKKGAKEDLKIAAEINTDFQDKIEQTKRMMKRIEKIAANSTEKRQPADRDLSAGDNFDIRDASPDNTNPRVKRRSI